jgi:hypothetical protein
LTLKAEDLHYPTLKKEGQPNNFFGQPFSRRLNVSPAI